MDISGIVQHGWPGSFISATRWGEAGEDLWSTLTLQAVLDTCFAWRDGVTPPTAAEVQTQEAAFLADQQSAIEAKTRAVKKREIRAEALSRIAAQVPALSSFEMVDFMVSLWPMLDAASAPTEVNNAKSVYQYAKTKMADMNTAPIAEVEAYDPAADTGWPA